MPVVDVSVIKAFNVAGVSIKKSFCVYVRLQGQAMRTNTVSGKHDEASFNERFRFQYRPERRKSEKNQLFVELWTKSLLSQSCVSVAWIDMDQQDFTQGVPITFNMHGGFEGRSATVMVVVVPVDFGSPRDNPQQQQLYPMQQQQQMYMQQQQQQQPYYPDAQPAVGVPLTPSASPYPTGHYMTAQPYDPSKQWQQQQQPHVKLDPITGQPISGGGCEAAPLPPPAAFNNATLPPPLYGNFDDTQPQQPPSNSVQPPYQPPAKQL